jgi:ankyrin repeat protein
MQGNMNETMQQQEQHKITRAQVKQQVTTMSVPERSRVDYLDLYDVEHRGEPPLLHEVCQTGPLHAVVALLKDNDEIDLQEKDDDGWMPLHHAIQGGNLDIIRYLIEEKGADMDGTMDTDEGLDALNLSIMDGHVDVIKYISEQYANARLLINTRNDSGLTPLLVAALEGHVKIMRYLVEKHDADITITDDDGWSALHYACLAGDLECVQYIVSSSSSAVDMLNVKEIDGWMPLHCAANSGHLRVVKYLLEECLVERDALIDNLDQNILHLAASEGCLEVTQYLIEEQGYDMTAFSSGDKTPLHLACIYGHAHIALYLIEEALLLSNDTRQERCEARHQMLFSKTSSGLTPYDSAVAAQLFLDDLDDPRQQDQVISYVQSYMTPLAVSGGNNTEPAVKLNPNLLNQQDTSLAKETLAIVQESPVQEVAYHILGYLCLSDVRS